MATPEAYDTLCSIGHLIDMLCNELIKCSIAQHRIIDERKKSSPNVEVIATQEWITRQSGEKRVKLRDEINRRIDEAIQRGGINVAAEARTYDLRGI